MDESGTLVGKYEYSAYGKCTILVDTDGIAKLNPFRFKCYYYDTESGMYYCQTRYFVPEWGRWLNADSPNFLQFDNINGMNLFAYCNNSPVMYADPSGEFLISFLVGLAVVGTSILFSAIDGGVSAVINGQDFWKGAATGAVGGAIGGLISLIPGFGIWGNVIGRVANSATYDILNEIFQNGSLQNMNWGLFVADLVMDATLSLLYAQGVSNLGNHFGKKFNGIISTVISSVCDSAIDIFQTKAYFSNAAQKAIRGY